MTSVDVMNKNKIDRETMDRQKSDSVIPIIQGMYKTRMRWDGIREAVVFHSDKREREEEL